MSAPLLTLVAQRVDEVPHVYDALVYPASVLAMEDTRGWRFGGDGGGNCGGAEKVPAPGRKGHALELWMEADKKNPAAPGRVFWEHALNPELMTRDAAHILVDIFPLNPVPFLITLDFGSTQGLGVATAAHLEISSLKPGVWQTIKIPVRPTRPHIDAVRFSVRVNQAGVPHRKTVHFLIDNLRVDPALDPVASAHIDTLQTRGRIKAGYFQITSRQELGDDAPLEFVLELSMVEPFEGRVELVDIDVGENFRVSAPFLGRPPYTLVRARIDDIAGLLPAGEVTLKLTVLDEAGHWVARGSRPFSLLICRSAEYVAQRNVLYERYALLRSKWDDLRQRDVVVNRPGATLAVAQWFLQEGGLLDNDYFGQGEYRIAQTSLNHIADQLDAVEKELADLESGRISEPPIPPFRPELPVEIRDGVYHQDGNPLLLIGGINWSQGMDAGEERITERLGLNAASAQFRMKDWLENHEHASERRARNLKFLNETLAAGLAVNVLLSGHYPPSPLPPRYKGARDEGAGSAMLPWNLVAPQTRQLFMDFYTQALPPLEGARHVINIETVNEPMHELVESALRYAEAFQDWARSRYKDVHTANRVWSTTWSSFKEIDLWRLFALRPESAGLNRDWHLFLSDVETGFLQMLTERILKELPHRQVTSKLIGHHPHFGYRGLNEQRIVLETQTLIGTDGSNAIWLDYLKSIKPGVPIVNAEWHVLKGPGVVDDFEQIQQRLFEGVAHGIRFGAIWNWKRRPWNTVQRGADQAMTRSPVTLNAIGRAAWQLRGLIGSLGRFANQNGGRVRLIFSNDSHLHQGINYMYELESVYRHCARNATGVRFIVPALFTPEDLAGIEFVATGSALYIETRLAASLAEWVHTGGTLWLLRPGLMWDPYGHPHEAVDADWLRAVSAPGTHPHGKGRVVVDRQPPLLEPYLDGPWPVGLDGSPVLDVKVRLTGDGNGGHWIYLMNVGKKRLHIRLSGWPEAVLRRFGMDHWNRSVINLSDTIKLNEYQVMLVHLNADD